MLPKHPRRGVLKLMAMAPLSGGSLREDKKPVDEGFTFQRPPRIRPETPDADDPERPVKAGRVVLRVDDDPETGQVWMVEYGVRPSSRGKPSRLVLALSDALPWGNTVSMMIAVMNDLLVQELESGVSRERLEILRKKYMDCAGLVSLGRLSGESVPIVQSAVEECRGDGFFSSFAPLHCSPFQVSVRRARYGDLERVRQIYQVALRIKHGFLITTDDFRLIYSSRLENDFVDYDDFEDLSTVD